MINCNVTLVNKNIGGSLREFKGGKNTLDYYLKKA